MVQESTVVSVVGDPDLEDAKRREVEEVHPMRLVWPDAMGACPAEGSSSILGLLN